MRITVLDLQVYDILRFITVFQFLFFAVFLLTIKKGYRVSNALFSLFLFSKALCFSDGLLFRFRERVLQWTPHLFFLGLSFEFLIGPALFLYTLSLTQKEFKIRTIHLLHFIPFLVHLVYMGFKYHFWGVATKVSLLQGYLFSYPEYITNYMLIYLHFICYASLTLAVLYRYRKQIKDYFSSITKIRLSWLSLIIWIFNLLWISSMIFFLLRIFSVRLYFPREFSIVMLFVFSNVIMYKGLSQPVLFTSQLMNNHKKSVLPDSTVSQYLEKLQKVMEDKKPFLDCELTLSDLSELTEIPQRHLSQVINQKLHSNFHDFINRYRVEEAKRLLILPAYNHFTIIAIAYEAGFNSKSVFNAIFKKLVKATPSQFQKTHQA